MKKTVRAKAKKKSPRRRPSTKAMAFTPGEVEDLLTSILWPGVSGLVAFGAMSNEHLLNALHKCEREAMQFRRALPKGYDGLLAELQRRGLFTEGRMR